MRTSATFLIRAYILAVLMGTAQWLTAQTSVNVTTAQQDIGVPDICANCVYRTGENLNEGTLTYDTLSTSTFGKLCEYDNLDGQVYGQPLVVTNVKWQGSGSTGGPAFRGLCEGRG